MHRGYLLLLGIGFALAAPAASSAETAYTTKTVNVRAGPSREYPLVAQAPAGVPVEVNGCVDDWTWCDISLDNDRGWVYAGNLESPYQDRRVVILGNGPIIGFPIVVFSTGPYWDTYYRGRPWYSRRNYFVQRPPAFHGIRPQSSRPPGFRPPAVRPSRPDVVRPPAARPSRPDVVRPSAARPSRPDVIRPPANRPQTQSQPPRPQGGRPEAARPQPVRPAPAKPPDNKPRSSGREDRKPGGN